MDYSLNDESFSNRMFFMYFTVILSLILIQKIWNNVNVEKK